MSSTAKLFVPCGPTSMLSSKQQELVGKYDESKHNLQLIHHDKPLFAHIQKVNNTQNGFIICDSNNELDKVNFLKRIYQFI